MADIMDNIVFATSQRVIGDTLFVAYSNGKIKTFDAVKLGCEWFNMSNDGFYSTYGFNFNPHEWGDILESIKDHLEEYEEFLADNL